MKLNQMFSAIPNLKKGKRVGRGIGSGKGKTCGRGVKGQKSRTGVALGGFEGGQNPIHTSLPKRGFNNIFAERFEIINLDDLQNLVDEKKLDSKVKLDKAKMKELGLIRRQKSKVKLLARGVISASITIECDAYSQKAAEELKKAGGEIVANS